MPTGEIEDRWFRLMAENASDVVVMSDRDGRFVWVSPSSERTLGLSPGDLVGRTAFDVVHPDDVDILRAAQEHVLSGEEQRFELRFAHADGSWKWWSILYRPVLDDAGEVIGRVCGWRDVDAQHAAQDALREQEEQFRLLAEHASDVVVQGSPDGVMEWVSPSVESAVGWRVEDLVGTAFTNIVDVRDLEVVRAAQDALRQGRPAKFEARLLGPDADPKWFAILATPIFTADGVPIGRVASWRDIDEQHRAQEALQQREEQLRFIIEQASDVVVMQVEGVPTFVSPAITPMLGWQPEDLLGRPIIDFWHPDDQARAAALRQRVQGGATGAALLRMRHVDGTFRWVEVAGRPASGADGRPGASAT
jgi:PAS domain S-box-containing protein